MKRSLILSLFLTLLFAPAANGRQTGAPTAQQVLERMISAYAALYGERPFDDTYHW